MSIAGKVISNEVLCSKSGQGQGRGQDQGQGQGQVPEYCGGRRIG